MTRFSEGRIQERGKNVDPADSGPRTASSYVTDREDRELSCIRYWW